LDADRAPQLKAVVSWLPVPPGSEYEAEYPFPRNPFSRLDDVWLSYRYDFVVINKSDRPIEVQYKLKRHPSGQYTDITPPAKLTLSEFERLNINGETWQRTNINLMILQRHLK
jgi:hypothetical protein